MPSYLVHTVFTEEVVSGVDTDTLVQSYHGFRPEETDHTFRQVPAYNDGNETRLTFKHDHIPDLFPLCIQS